MWIQASARARPIVAVSLCAGLAFILAGCGSGGHSSGGGDKVVCPEPSKSRWRVPSRAAPQNDRPISWDVATAMATKTLASMGDCDKYRLMQGIAWKNFSNPDWGYYIGNTLPNPELGIPSLNINDASGGFRTIWDALVGTVTAWPSQLALAATWSPVTVGRFAVALGEEFAAKGATVALGPSINVHRVAQGGRNFEYLSGEDPYLGAALADAWVRGVQSQGVMAVMKHYVLNNQETNRQSASSDADDVTKWELYYPPFQAAVEAGVSAAMCSYNKVGGNWSCSNPKSLQDLRRMGFKGFVQSDWWATHDTSVLAGLDQNMPGEPTEQYFSPAHLASLPKEAIDNSVTRILAAMHRMDLFGHTRCAPPHCGDLIWANVTSEAHDQLAQDIAAESIVLLKNRRSVLPLRNDIRRIAIVGSVAAAQPYNPALPGNDWHRGDYYSGGGSGHVTAANITTPLAAILARARAKGIETTAVTATNDTAAAVSAAKWADVTLVFAGTTSGESEDRSDLSLDDDADALIKAVAAAAKSTVVLLEIPGAVLTPWRDDVDAIAAMFLGGQASGAAWVNILFGDVAPAGRLPLMLPASEHDYIPPSTEDHVVYSEGVHTSYRNTSFSAAFPFGHGLTYTLFEYSEPAGSECAVERQAGFCISFRIHNRGWLSARALPQLYLEFPESNFDVPVLKGFQKTDVIRPMASVEVVLILTRRELSYYAPGVGDWVPVKSAVAHIGESSRDIRGKIAVSLGAEDPGSYLV